MEAQFQGFEVEYPRDVDNNNNTNCSPLQPVIPGTNLPIQTETVPEKSTTKDVVLALEPEPEPENLPWSGPDATFMEETGVVEPTVLIGPLMTGLEEDPHSPKTNPPPSNYQTKVTDPTGEGGKEVEVDPLLKRLDKFHIHDQSSPTVDQVMKSDKAAPAASTEDLVASNKKPVSATEYRRKAAEVLAPVYGKVAVLSKFGSDKGVSVREYLGEKLRPGEDDKALSDAIFGRFRKKEEVVVVQPERSLGVMDRLKGALGSSSWLGKSKSDVGTIPGVGTEHVKEKEEQTTTGEVTSG